MRDLFENFRWALGGAVVVVLIGVVTQRLQDGTKADHFTQFTRKAETLSRLRETLATSLVAQKSAVLAVSDEASKRFADQTRAGNTATERMIADLARVIGQDGDGKQKEAIARLQQALVALTLRDEELLSLAVRNTNIKASALALGAATEQGRTLDEALATLATQAAETNSTNAKKILALATSAQAAALRVRVLFAPHIAEADGQKMDVIEAQMREEDERVTHALAALAPLVPDRATLSRALTSHARFLEIKAEILTLSRENTNVRSLALALDQDLKARTVAEDALSSLEKSLEEERELVAKRMRAR